MRPTVIVALLVGSTMLCSCAGTGPPGARQAPVPATAEATPLEVAREELESRGQSLHERLEFRVVEKDWGWIVTVGNLTGRQPKGRAYIPGDAVLIRIDRDGGVIEYTPVP